MTVVKDQPLAHHYFEWDQTSFDDIDIGENSNWSAFCTIDTLLYLAKQFFFLDLLESACLLVHPRVRLCTKF